jgi:WD40 repeat protein
LLAAGSDGGSTLVWDLGTGRAQTLFKGHTGPVYSASFSQCSTTLATGGADCAVRTWEVHTKTKAEKSKSGHGSGGVVKVEKSVSQNTLSGSDNKKMQVGGAGPISGNANQSMLSQTLRVVSPLQSFYTKCTPVHHVRFSSQNLVCAAGPFSLASASTDSYTGASAPKSA